MNILIFDCEIKNLIPDRNKPNDPNYLYCDSWGDFKGMGISVIGTWCNFEIIEIDKFNKETKPLKEGVLRCFTEENFNDFYTLTIMCDRLVGFNSIAFDDPLCNAHKLPIKTDFDVLVEIRKATGQPPNYIAGKTRSGYSLDSLSKANLAYSKKDSGSNAPKLYQDGKLEDLRRYCLFDVALTKEIYFKFISNQLLDPTTGDRIIYN